MKKINFYIGSNNQTKELETDKALTILSAEYEGMNVSELIGYWKGEREKTLLISIVCEQVDYTQVKRVCKQINNQLDQQAVLVEVLDTNALFISER